MVQHAKSKDLCSVNIHNFIEGIEIMKKTAFVLSLILLIPIFSITAIADSGPNLEMEIRGVWSKNVVINRNFRIIIENSGDETALGTECDIWVFGGIQPNARTYWGFNVGDINPGISRIVPFHDFNLPFFGIIEMTVQVQAENMESITQSIKAIAFGFIWVI